MRHVLWLTVFLLGCPAAEECPPCECDCKEEKAEKETPADDKKSDEESKDGKAKAKTPSEE